MNNLLPPDEQRRFKAWTFSPSVYSTNSDELIIAYKLGKLLHYPSSKVLKALRGLEGLSPAMVQQVEEYVMADPSLVFSGEAPTRLVAFKKD